MRLADPHLGAHPPSAKYSPDQPRVPAGNSDGGQWTDGGGGGGSSGLETIGGAAGQDDLGDAKRPGYPTDLLEEEVRGGHTFERHVGKTEEYLKARILNSRTNIPFLNLSWGEARAGSFWSLEAANKLVNSTMSDPENRSKVEAFARRDLLYSLPVLQLFKTFDSPTGYEAYARGDRKPIMRKTYSVRVRLYRDESPKGFYVDSAWPENSD